MFLIISNGIAIGSLKLTFYAVCILIGAISAYKLSQYHMKKRGYDPKDLENLFYVAFPSGIIGARIWYVIAQWNIEFYNRPFWHVFALWEGGLAIQGGIIGGVGIGVSFVLLFRKHINILDAVDSIVPTIFVAQAIGRWGNFFNQEVYGKPIDTLKFLPKFITDRLTYEVSYDYKTGLINGYMTDSNGNYVLLDGLKEGQMAMPLFLIEGLLNIACYLIIILGIPYLFNFLEKKTNGKVRLAKGSQMCLYILAYGIIRACLEPLRNVAYQMGTANNASSIMAFVFIGVAPLGILACYLYEYLVVAKRVKETSEVK